MSKLETLKKLSEILKADPNTKFIYIRRIDDDFSGDIIDVPVKQVEMTIKLHPTWEIVESIKQMDDDIAALFADDNNDPEKVDELKVNNEIIVPATPEHISDEEFEKIMSEDVSVHQETVSSEKISIQEKNKKPARDTKKRKMNKTSSKRNKTLRTSLDDSGNESNVK